MLSANELENHVCSCGVPLPEEIIAEGKTPIFYEIVGPLGGWHRPVVNCPSCGVAIYFQPDKAKGD